MSGGQGVSRRSRAALARLTGNKRSVIWTYPGLRMGNVLYLALRAHAQQARGGDVVALLPEPGNEWSAAFPRMSQLVVRQQAVRRLDSRIDLPALFFQNYGFDFSAAELTAFVHEVLLDERASCDLVPSPHSAPILTLNIRRGDYYSVPEFRRAYGFDVDDYVGTAVRCALAQGAALTTCVVVSDDAAWCRSTLAWLDTMFDEVQFHGPDEGILDSFTRVATGRTLILTNSTFSYWAGYVSEAMHGATGQIFVPDVHAWTTHGGRAWQHSPTWRRLPVRPLR